MAPDKRPGSERRAPLSSSASQGRARALSGLAPTMPGHRCAASKGPRARSVAECKASLAPGPMSREARAPNHCQLAGWSACARGGRRSSSREPPVGCLQLVDRTAQAGTREQWFVYTLPCRVSITSQPASRHLASQSQPTSQPAGQACLQSEVFVLRILALSRFKQAPRDATRRSMGES